MPYNSTIPALDNAKSTDSVSMQTNFLQLYTSWNTNHAILGGGTNEGKHTFVTLPDLVVVPATTPLATSATEVMLYATNEALVFRPHSQAAGDVANDIDFTTITGAGVEKSTKLPSGLILKWGKAATVLTGAGVPDLYTFPVAFPTACYSVMLTRITPTGEHNRDHLYVTDVLAASFIPVCNSHNDYFHAACEFYYFAIGK